MNKIIKIILILFLSVIFLFWVKNTSFDSLIKSRAKIDPKIAERIAVNYIENLDQYKNYGGKDIVKIFDPISNCPNCWKIGYEFILEKKRQSDLPFRGKVIIELQGNQVKSAKYEEISNISGQISDFKECIDNQYQELVEKCLGCPKRCKTPDGQIFLQEASDPIYILLQEIDRENGIGFSEIEDVKFNWNYFDGTQMQKQRVSGLGYHAQDILKSGASIARYLKDNGFMTSIDNTTPGDFKSLDGFIKDDIVCLLQEIITQQGEISQTQNLPRSLKINCGKIIKEDQNNQQ